jgi:phosphotransferase system  glucose/maltose/N-acetylglucosamine-specific IIC component
MEKEQHELYEYARKRIKQKKNLYYHFVLFLVTSLFMFITNKLLLIEEQYNWFLWVSTAWFFFFILHFINVFITNRFMDKNWERAQIESLIKKQELKINELEKNNLNN